MLTMGRALCLVLWEQGIATWSWQPDCFVIFINLLCQKLLKIKIIVFIYWTIMWWTLYLVLYTYYLYSIIILSYKKTVSLFYRWGNSGPRPYNVYGLELGLQFCSIWLQSGLFPLCYAIFLRLKKIFPSWRFLNSCFFVFLVTEYGL